MMLMNDNVNVLVLMVMNDIMNVDVNDVMMCRRNGYMINDVHT